MNPFDSMHAKTQTKPLKNDKKKNVSLEEI